jgi:hypothetical protein
MSSLAGIQATIADLKHRLKHSHCAVLMPERLVVKYTLNKFIFLKNY